MKPTLTTIGIFGSVLVLWFSAPHLSGAETNPKTTLQLARTAAKAQRPVDAVAAYEKVVADPSRDAAKYTADALYELLLLRVSADPAVHDAARAALAIDGLRAYPAYPRAQEIAVIGTLLQEADRRAAEEKQLREAGEQRLAETTSSLKTASAKADDLAKQLALAKQSDEAGKLRVEGTSLRTENKNLRDQLAKLQLELQKTQAELQKKDDALKKVAGSLMKGR